MVVVVVVILVSPTTAVIETEPDSSLSYWFNLSQGGKLFHLLFRCFVVVVVCVLGTRD